jgi:hypothetical protein
MSTRLRYLAPCIAVVALLCGATSAFAGTVGLHVGSVHIPYRDAYNNFNPGVYYRADAGWTAGVYRNSLSKTSVYAGYTLQYSRFGLTAGGATGYQQDIQPLLVPSVTLFTVHGATTRIAYVPRVEKRIESHVLHLMLEFP